MCVFFSPGFFFFGGEALDLQKKLALLEDLGSGTLKVAEKHLVAQKKISRDMVDGSEIQRTSWYLVNIPLFIGFYRSQLQDF